MSPAWWADRLPELAENKPEGRALRLLRRFLTPEQLQGMDEMGYFRVQGKEHVYLFRRGDQFIYKEARPGEAGREVFNAGELRATHQLCIHAVELLPEMTLREYYRMKGVDTYAFAPPDVLDAPMPEIYRYDRLPLYDSLLAKKLLIEADESKLWEIAVVSPLTPLAARDLRGIIQLAGWPAP